MTFNLPVFLTMALFADPLLSIFGAEFATGATGLTILAFATLFNASTGVCGSVITMTGHSRMTFLNSVFNLGLNLALDILLIPRLGIVGAALGVTLSEVTLNVIRTIQVFVLLRIWPFDWSFLKPIASSLIAVGATYLVGQRIGFFPVALRVILGTLLLWSVYTAGVVLLKLSDEDRLVLRTLKARFRLWRS
jgi:O-antigen/teichoic acid export membrane protein